MAQKKPVSTTVKKVTSTAKTVVKNVKKDPIGSTAAAAKAVVGGVTGAAQAGISKVANSKLLKGTKAGTAVELSNTLVGMPGSVINIGISSLAGLASGIYQGKTIAQLEKMVADIAVKEAKGNVDAVIKQAMACLQVYDPSLTSKEVGDFFKDLGQSAKAKLKKA
ncbi:MAG: hypothetical protein FWD40_00780 [Treponema sp.]|nr:hypothetical protein [Treponema sp.]